MRGALVPHAPLLLPAVTSRSDELREIWDGLGRLSVPEEALVVVVTPHASSTGVYANNVGSLDGFGLPGISGAFRSGPADALELPTIDVPLDHGALVPMLLLGIASAVVVVGVVDMTDVAYVVREVRHLATNREVFVIASAHTSARLTERAPLPYSFDALRLDTRLITDIESDCGAASTAAQNLVAVGSSCSGPTLRAFGELFAGAEGSVLAYGFPFGVGYPVVSADIDV